MRLTEEKSLIKTEVILLTFVVLTGIGVQICSNKIDSYSSELLKQFSLLNLTENERLGQKVSSLRYLFSVFANANVDVDFDEAYGNPNLDEEYKHIIKEFESGKISKLEYFNKLSVKHNKTSYGLYKKYLTLNKEKELLLQERPIWYSIRNIFFVLQFGAIIFALAIYYFIFKSISSRTKS